MHRKPALFWRGALFALVVLAGLHWVSQLFMTPNQRLVDLVAELSHQQSYSTVIASALIATALLFSAILVPLMTLFAIFRHERQSPMQPPPQQLTTIQPHEALPAAPQALPQHREVIIQKESS